MKSDPLPRDFSELVEKGGRLLDTGGTVEDLLTLARSRDYSKITSIRLLVAVRPLILADAKHVVHHSATWSDRKEQDDRFHEILRRLEG